MDGYKVYVKTDNTGCITAINSNAFLSSFDGWQEIDSGTGDKYHHAQGNYFSQPLYDDSGICRYKLVDGVAVERTIEEIEADYKPSIVEPTTEERLTQLEEALNLLLEGATE